MIVSAAAHDQPDALLTGDVLAHLDGQLVAARRLLALVLDQGAAIRQRDVQNVARLAGMLQAEMQRRQLIETERMRLLERAGARLGVTPTAVTLSLLTQLMHPDAAHEAQARSSELRGMLDVVQREHICNRALMSQELAFLDHLLRLTDGGSGGYDAGGDRATTSPGRAAPGIRVFDLEA
jgi:hypothetical protein